MSSESTSTERVIPILKTEIYYTLAKITAFLLIGVIFISKYSKGNLRIFFNEHPFVPFFSMLLAFVLMLSVGYYRDKVLNKNWKSLAIDQSLTFTRNKKMPAPTLDGNFRNYKVLVEVTMEKIRRGRYNTYTHFIITLNNPIEHNLTVKPRQSVVNKQNQIGDRILDQHYIIKSTSTSLLNEIVENHRLRRGLLELGDPYNFNELTISSSTIHYIENNVILNHTYIEAVLRYLTDLANRVEQNEDVVS